MSLVLSVMSIVIISKFMIIVGQTQQLIFLIFSDGEKMFYKIGPSTHKS
jgi:hypothetical protein